MNKKQILNILLLMSFSASNTQNVSQDKNTNSSQYSIYLRAADPASPLTTNNPSQEAKKIADKINNYLKNGDLTEFQKNVEMFSPFYNYKPNDPKLKDFINKIRKAPNKDEGQYLIPELYNALQNLPGAKFVTITIPDSTPFILYGWSVIPSVAQKIKTFAFTLSSADLQTFSENLSYFVNHYDKVENTTMNNFINSIKNPEEQHLLNQLYEALQKLPSTKSITISSLRTLHGGLKTTAAKVPEATVKEILQATQNISHHASKNLGPTELQTFGDNISKFFDMCRNKYNDENRHNDGSKYDDEMNEFLTKIDDTYLSIPLGNLYKIFNQYPATRSTIITIPGKSYGLITKEKSNVLEKMKEFCAFSFTLSSADLREFNEHFSYFINNYNQVDDTTMNNFINSIKKQKEHDLLSQLYEALQKLPSTELVIFSNPTVLHGISIIPEEVLPQATRKSHIETPELTRHLR